MFCKYCGKKMDNVSEVCPNCQKEQGSLQATDGFLGVLMSGNVVADRGKSDSNDKKLEEMNLACKKLKNDVLSLSDSMKKYRKKVNISGTVSIIIILLLAFVFAFMYCVHAQRSAKELEILNNKVVTLENQLQEVSASSQQNAVICEDRLEQMEMHFANELAVLKDGYEQQIEALQEETSKILDSLKQDFEVQLQELKEEYHPVEVMPSESDAMTENDGAEEIAVEEGDADE